MLDSIQGDLYCHVVIETPVKHLISKITSEFDESIDNKDRHNLIVKVTEK